MIPESKNSSAGSISVKLLRNVSVNDTGLQARLPARNFSMDRLDSAAFSTAHVQGFVGSSSGRQKSSETTTGMWVISITLMVIILIVILIAAGCGLRHWYYARKKTANEPKEETDAEAAKNTFSKEKLK
ncbi:hypothetical protein L596_009364 [Steinernema carpocapsae]|uniref:Uncharacterized protein n=2 Tax=Steinernema carpocapsae TaxID=34508 RepID=A0A4U5PFF2_STECR|nr:hypothetical protein L596_009364 [Steinernema carpocapsae]